MPAIQSPVLPVMDTSRDQGMIRCKLFQRDMLVLQVNDLHYKSNLFFLWVYNLIFLYLYIISSQEKDEIDSFTKPLGVNKKEHLEMPKIGKG